MAHRTGRRLASRAASAVGLSKVPSLFKYFPPRKGRVEIPVRIFPGELVLLIRALLILNISPDEFSSEEPVRGA